MKEYYHLQSYLSFKGIEFDKWLIRHRHLTLEQRQAAWAYFCDEVQSVAHQLHEIEETMAIKKELLAAQEWRGIA